MMPELLDLLSLLAGIALLLALIAWGVFEMLCRNWLGDLDDDVNEETKRIEREH